MIVTGSFSLRSKHARPDRFSRRTPFERSEKQCVYCYGFYKKTLTYILTRCVNKKCSVLVLVTNVLTLTGQLDELNDPLGSKCL